MATITNKRLVELAEIAKEESPINCLKNFSMPDNTFSTWYINGKIMFIREILECNIINKLFHYSQIEYVERNIRETERYLENMNGTKLNHSPEYSLEWTDDDIILTNIASNIGRLYLLKQIKEEINTK